MRRLSLPAKVGVDIDDPAADERRDVGRVLVWTLRLENGRCGTPRWVICTVIPAAFIFFRRQSNHAGVRRGGRRIRPVALGGGPSGRALDRLRGRTATEKLAGVWRIANTAGRSVDRGH